MIITKEKMSELADYYYKRAELFKQQGFYESYNYYCGKANTYKLLATSFLLIALNNSIEQQGSGNP